MAESLRSSSIPIEPTDSVPAERGDSVPVPTEPDPLCATCGYLRWLYGDDDPELIAHIDAGHPVIHDPNSVAAIDKYIAHLNNNSPAN